MQSEASDEQRVWERTCHDAVTSDVLWKLDAYRGALFLLHLARGDCRQLGAARFDRIVDQLLSAAGSVSANLSEGYSRSTRADRVRFLGYALGSTRECVSWYLAVQGEISDAVIDARLALLARLRAMVLGLTRALRGKGPNTAFEP
jgi:four helix bundle protein